MKKIILFILKLLVRHYFKKRSPQLVVVAGSVGKTSTKEAIAAVLATEKHVRVNPGSFNDVVSAPVVMVGADYPEHVSSPLAWLKVFYQMWQQAKRDDVEVIVQELGTERVGEIPWFASFLKPNIAVVTAVADEHMQNFGTLDAVAREELAIARCAKLTLINKDMVDGGFASYAETNSIDTYGLSNTAEYYIDLADTDTTPLDGKMGRFVSPEYGEASVNLQLVGRHNVYAAVAAAAVATKLGLSISSITQGVSKITPLPGRMQLLRGVKGSWLIDDSYNSSPAAAIAAIDTLYQVEQPQKIVILGSMNELGATSAASHALVGEYCDPTRIEWVVTVGEEAAKYLAPAATKAGNRVKSFMSPYEAAGFVHSVLSEGQAAVLIKGSQNGVFTEEAVKVLLHSGEDEKRLVRQSAEWLRVKEAAFGKPVVSDD